MYVKFERVIIISFPTMNLNSSLHLTLKLEMPKVKVKDKVHNGYCSSRCIYSFVYVKFERVIISYCSFCVACEA